MNVATIKEIKPKHQVVYDYLIAAIKNGKFIPERKLPSERALAEEFNVNLATIRRAFKELVVSGVVEKRVGDGTYLKTNTTTEQHGDHPVINILLSNYDGPVHKEFVEAIFMEAQRRKLSPQIIKIPLNDYLPSVRVINPEQPLLVLSEETFVNGPLRKMLKNTFANVVLIGARLDGEGICSVIGDDNYGIRLLVEHLRAAGHRRIALVCNNLLHPLEKTQAAIWRSLLEDDYAADLLINAGVPVSGQPMDYAFSAVEKVLKDRSFTALICLNDELAIGAMAACRDAGKRIPEDIATVSIGNTALCKYSYPRLTSIDPDMKGHVKQAFDLLLSKNHDHGDNLRIIKPLLIKRDSVGAATVN